MESLHSMVERQVTNYPTQDVTITDAYRFNQYQNLQQIENFSHSQYASGQLDGNGNPKPFFNITTAKKNIAIRATDIDRKDIQMKTTDSDEEFRSFVATKFNRTLMNKMKFNEYLNSWGERLPKYGSCVTKVVRRGKTLEIKVVDWFTLVCDPVKFDSAPVIEKISLTPSELRLKQKDGWDSQIIEDLIENYRSSRKDIRGNEIYADPDFITVFEVHGNLPLSYLKDKPSKKDETEYTQQMQVIAIGKNESDQIKEFTLYKGKESKNPYSISHWEQADGRTLGVGVVEAMFQPQIWYNYNALLAKKQLDLASTTILQTMDRDLTAKNVLTNMQSGDFLVHAPQGDVTPINFAPQGVAALQASNEVINRLAESITSTPDGIQGNTPPSGTAFRTVAMLNTEAHSYFDYITENKGNYIESLYREYVIPFIASQLSTSDEIVAVLSSEEIEWFDNEVANMAVTEELKKQTIAGNIVSPIQLDQLRQQKLSQLKKTGAKRYLNSGKGTWKDYFKDYEWECEINITGESQDKKAALDTLSTALQMVAANPGILQNPTTKMLFMKLIDLSGVVSSLEIEGAAASAPPQQPQGQPVQGQPQQGQPQMPQPQPQQAQPMPTG